MAILSIQSQVACGHVGNAAAIFALQRLGREVWPVATTLLSHHPGHGGAGGGPVQPDLLDEILDGLRRHGCFTRCDAVLSGYLAHEDAAARVLRAVALAKANTPGALYLCDPVLGDDGRLYVREEIVAVTHNLAAKADIITPNAFELMTLSGHDFETRGQALRAMRALQARGPHIVLLSSFSGTDTPPETLDIFAMEGEAAWGLNTPRLDRKFHGAGDLLAAMFLHEWLRRRDTGAALGRAAAIVQAVLAETAAAQADELRLIQAQSLLAAPMINFVPERIA